MAAIGAKYKWKEGKILHASRLWKAPTKRRIPRMLIEDRAQEVGITISLEEPWIVFAETTEVAEKIDLENAVELGYYYNRYYLLPEHIGRIDTYEWLGKGNTLLLWAHNNHYYVKPMINFSA